MTNYLSLRTVCTPQNPAFTAWLADVMHLAASLRLAKHDLLDFLDECCLGALLPGSEQERLVAEPCLGEGGALTRRRKRI